LILKLKEFHTAKKWVKIDIYLRSRSHVHFGYSKTVLYLNFPKRFLQKLGQRGKIILSKHGWALFL